MSSASKSNRGWLNVTLWAIVAVSVAIGVVGNSYFSDESLLYRVLALVALGIVAAVIALQTTQGAAFSGLVRDARIEIRKVIWPTHQETLQMTGIVLVVVLVTALILWGLDSLLGWAISKTIG